MCSTPFKKVCASHAQSTGRITVFVKPVFIFLLCLTANLSVCTESLAQAGGGPEVAQLTERLKQGFKISVGDFADPNGSAERNTFFGFAYATEFRNGNTLEIDYRICRLTQKPVPIPPVGPFPWPGPRPGTPEQSDEQPVQPSADGVDILTANLGSKLIDKKRLKVTTYIGAGGIMFSKSSYDEEEPEFLPLGFNIDPVIHLKGSIQIPLFEASNGMEIGFEVNLSSLTSISGKTSFRGIEGEDFKTKTGINSAIHYDGGLVVSFNKKYKER